MSSLTQCHYDKPQSHNALQTRWVLPANKKIYAPSLRILDLLINPNQASYFPALTGAYSCVKRFQVYLNKKLAHIWNAQEILSMLIAESGDAEKQNSINKILYNTGNNCEFDNDSALLMLNRNPVDTNSVTLKLTVFSDLLNKINIVNDEIEIIVDWEQNLNKMLVPVDPTNPATSVNIPAPFLSYETIVTNMEQPKQVIFRNFVRDMLTIPVAEDGVIESNEIRSNAFNQKRLGRMLFVNIPSSIMGSNPNDDAKNLYNLFGYYMSVPMSRETWNVALNGRNIMTFRNVSNDATKLSFTNDIWGQAFFVSGGHSHNARSVLKELDDDTSSSLNGFASYGCVELEQFVGKDLALTYTRRGEADYPTLTEQLNIAVIAEVYCVYENGHVVYLTENKMGDMNESNQI